MVSVRRKPLEINLSEGVHLGAAFEVRFDAEESAKLPIPGTATVGWLHRVISDALRGSNERSDRPGGSSPEQMRSQVAPSPARGASQDHPDLGRDPAFDSTERDDVIRDGTDQNGIPASWRPVCGGCGRPDRFCCCATNRDTSERAVVVLDQKNPFAHARKIMTEAFLSDEDLWRSYRDNIAMLLHDQHGITGPLARNEAAAGVMKLIFDTVGTFNSNERNEIDS